MERGVGLARQYGVDRLLQPIFDYTAGPDSPPLAPKHITAAPSRPRKKQDIANDFDMQPPPAPPKPQRAAVKKANARKAAAAARNAAMEHGHPDSDEDYQGEGKAVKGGRGETPARGNRSASEQSETPSPYGDVQDEYGIGPSKKRKKEGVKR